MFHESLEEPEYHFDPLDQIERHALRMAIELARAEGFEGTEAAFVELLRALEESQGISDA